MPRGNVKAVSTTFPLSIFNFNFGEQYEKAKHNKKTGR